MIARAWMVPLVVSFCLGGLQAQDFSKMPAWARPTLEASANETPPPEADAWVLFDRTEVAYSGKGEIRKRRLRLVKVLGERGFSEAYYSIGGIGGKASKIEKLKGWNLRPDGDLTRLDQDRVLTIQNASAEAYSTHTLTMAGLPRVMKGSLIAFESLEAVQHPLGPIESLEPLESHPIRRWELELAKQEGWFKDLKNVAIRMDCRHFKPWIAEPTNSDGKHVVLDNLPPLPKAQDESMAPHPHNTLPAVHVCFLDPELQTAPSWLNWDEFATWNFDRFKEQERPGPLPDFKGLQPMEGLQRLSTWMLRELQYRQVYLTPERGWVPLAAEETGRNQYGDCKDFACFFIAHAQRLGIQGYPVLCRIQMGQLEENEALAPAFNHAILALRLEKSLGLPAEVDTPKGRFLFVDPTDHLTPLGQLGEAHRGRRLLICLAGGGQWVQIPDSAILHSHVEMHLKGEAGATGLLKATLQIKEQGAGLGLRYIAFSGGRTKLKEYLLQNLLDLPPTATLTITNASEPSEREKDYLLDLELQQPDGIQLGNGEIQVKPLGLKLVPPRAQAPGKPRQYPVVVDSDLDWEYDAELNLPWACEPFLRDKTAETPFRRLTWRAVTTSEVGGSLLKLQLHHQAKSAFFDFDRREEGVTEAKKDRALVRNLLTDGWLFKVKP